MGTRGVPASYGGFETAVEEIGKRLAARGEDVTVYCRNPGQTLTEYEGMHLVNLPALRHRMAETLSHTSLSAARAIIRDKPDVALVLNAGNAPLIKPLQAAGIPVAIHLDGLESKREKWRGAGARYYRWAEKVAVKNGDAVIADAQSIADQGSIECIQQVAPAGIQAAVGVRSLHGLGGQHHVRAAVKFLQQRSQQFLADAHAVTVCSVDEGAAGIEEGSELIARLVLIGLLAPGHGS